MRLIPLGEIVRRGSFKVKERMVFCILLIVTNAPANTVCTRTDPFTSGGSRYDRCRMWFITRWWSLNMSGGLYFVYTFTRTQRVLLRLHCTRNSPLEVRLAFPTLLRRAPSGFSLSWLQCGKRRMIG